MAQTENEESQKQLLHLVFGGELTNLEGVKFSNLDMITEEGLETIWARHGVFANAVRAAVAAWSSPGGLDFNIIDPAHRSNSTTTILSGSVDAERLCQICEKDAGLTLGIGLGEFAGRSFRIGHMGHMNPPMVLGTLSTIEAALKAMDAPIGASGAAAAANVIADALREGAAQAH